MTSLFNVSYGEISGTRTGRSRRGIITYYLWKQNITINGVLHEVTAGDSSWLKYKVNELIKEEQKKFYKLNKQFGEASSKMMFLAYLIMVGFCYMWFSLFFWIIS